MVSSRCEHVDRRRDARIVAGKEADERDHQHRRVESRVVVGLGERAELGVVAALAHLVVDLVADLAPPLRPALAAVRRGLDHRDRAVERDPAHHLRVREVAARARAPPRCLRRARATSSRATRAAASSSAHASSSIANPARTLSHSTSASSPYTSSCSLLVRGVAGAHRRELVASPAASRARAR